MKYIVVFTVVRTTWHNQIMREEYMNMYFCRKYAYDCRLSKAKRFSNRAYAEKMAKLREDTYVMSLDEALVNEIMNT